MADYFLAFDKASFEKGLEESFLFEGTVEQFDDCFIVGENATFEDCLVIAEASGMIVFKRVN